MTDRYNYQVMPQNSFRQAIAGQNKVSGLLMFFYSLTILVCIAVGFACVNAYASTYTLFPTDDTYVEKSAPINNFGGATYFSASADSPLSWAYLKFYLGDIQSSETIIGATMDLYSFFGYKSAGEVYHVSDDSWSETSLTWNTQPQTDTSGSLLDTAYIQNPNTLMTWNLFNTGKWHPDEDQTDKYLSLLIKAPIKTLFFYSKKMGQTFSPSLSITTDNRPIIISTPIPGSLLLFMAGIGGLKLFRSVVFLYKKFKKSPTPAPVGKKDTVFI